MDGGLITTTTTPLYTSAVNFYLRSSLTAARPLVFVMSWRCCGWGGLPPVGLSNVVSAVGGRNPQSVAPPWGGAEPPFFYLLYITYFITFHFRMSEAGTGSMLNKALSGLGMSSSEGSSSVAVGGARGGPGKSRCKRGSRRNKAGDCVRVAGYTAKKRCANGSRRSKVSGACEKIDILVKKVAKEALAEVAELKKADAAVASAGVDRLAAARAAAALKRQKKSAAKTARIKGKIAAAEAREKKAVAVEKEVEKDREDLLAKIARTRKAMGIRKNEENPASLARLIKEWEEEAMVRRYKKGSAP